MSFYGASRLAKQLLGEAVCTAVRIGERTLGLSESTLGRAIASVHSVELVIALTFDDGPSEATLPLAELLTSYGARGTFFVCGSNAKRYGKVLTALADAGHEIGNHTYSHPQLYFSKKAFLKNEICNTQEVMRVLGMREPTLFRPPFGSRWFGLRQIEQELGLRRILWSSNGRDWTGTAPEIAQRILQRIKPGAIVLLHDGRELQPYPEVSQTVEAVRIILQKLSPQGYRFVTVSELLARAD